ncbi:TetR/AcrR family transcriptional regulator [Erwinia sp. JUb26]|uniref:TetR/AcrR family transcriptional regulator n=1 Tax=Erwinia sp. JUb26 TaxID=2485126 RepID=UPI000F4A5A9D|nr:TetR/AcrR family transcriptional regulator [Erwinia sp. JUb26]ROR09844.1 TetR family transcriptional regulator [Erwinia sp. JUb26]
MRTLTDEKRNAILAAASAVFQEFGYERASMNEVAKRAGGSKATLYNYFPSKEALFENVVRTYSTHYLTQAASELDRKSNASLSLEEKLTVFGKRMLSVLTTDSQAMQLYRVVVGEAGHSDIGELFRESGVRESMTALTVLMQASMDQGALSVSSPELRAKQFTSLVKAEVDELLLKREVETLSEDRIQKMVSAAVTLFIKGAC